MNPGTAAFIKLVNNPFKFRLFLFTKLPSAFFAGVRIQEMDADHCKVIVPYKWFSQNPFRSTYFACLSMAGEMSTGALAMAHIHQRSPAISMLVVKVESQYFKKATDLTTFTCEDGPLIARAADEAIASGEVSTVRARSTGRNKNGEIVCELFVTWSFKAKQAGKK
jgi:hypothetical protein